jgi:hypothetical protein
LILLILAKNTHVVVGLCISGLDLDGLQVTTNGLFSFAHQVTGDPQVVVSLDIVGGDLDGSFKQLLSLLHPP